MFSIFGIKFRFLGLRGGVALAGLFLSLVVLISYRASSGELAFGQEAGSSSSTKGLPLQKQSQAQADQESKGCLGCHEGIESMHASTAVRLSCVDCHGGKGDEYLGEGVAQNSAEYERVKKSAHILPRFPERWKGTDGRYSSANPERSYTLLNNESPEFVRFVNPGDLRVAPETCGICHPKEVTTVRKMIQF